MVFFDIKGAEQATQGGSKSNRVEAAAVVEALKKLLDGGLSLGQIGMVSPYAAQVQILSELTRSIDGSRDDGRGRYSSSDAGGHQDSGLHVCSCSLDHAEHAVMCCDASVLCTQLLGLLRAVPSRS